MKSFDRRQFLTRMAAGTSLLAAAGVHGGALGCKASGPTSQPQPSGPLTDPLFQRLPLGAIRPRGWLARQLRIHADELSGHLDEFRPDVAQSRWFGGDAEGWERAPYWLDGVIPLAWVLDDAGLKDRVNQRVDQLLRGQQSDGRFTPMVTHKGDRPYDLWAILLVNKMLVQHHEAFGDERTFHAVEASLRFCDAENDHPNRQRWKSCTCVSSRWPMTNI
jgi:hypothetical protein